MNCYLVNTRDPSQLERIWHYVETSPSNTLWMYRKKLVSDIGYVVECADTRHQTMFLLQFGHLVSQL